MSKRTKALTRELHDKGLRKKVAGRVARAMTAAPDGGVPEEAREVAEELRRLASELESGGEAQAATTAAEPETREPAAPERPRRPPSSERVRPRARRN